jgi:hypothetical protein
MYFDRSTPQGEHVAAPSSIESEQQVSVFLILSTLPLLLGLWAWAMVCLRNHTIAFDHNIVRRSHFDE